MKRVFSIFTVIFALSVLAAAQTTAFNFQGRLNDGSNPANGRYDLQFKLFDSTTGGTQLGSTDRPNLMLINGVFSTQLDFGAAAFTGSDRFIEIGLRATGSGNQFVILGPRQQILSVPYSIRSLRTTLADDASNSQNLGGIAPTGFILNRTFPQTADFNVSGSGTLGGRLSVGGDANIGGNVGIGGNTTTDKLSVTGNTRINGDTLFNGNITINNDTTIYNKLGVRSNVTQSLDGSGLPKAMLKINADGTIAKCYNGITGANTGNCGYTVDHFTMGGYGITFGFGTDSSFVSVSVEYDRANSDFVAANYSTSAFFGHLDVYTFRFPNAIPTAPIDRPFTIILY